jgi:hypothetical protein
MNQQIDPQSARGGVTEGDHFAEFPPGIDAKQRE